MDIPAPQVLAKTATSITFRLPTILNTKIFKYKLACSEYGYLYYSWVEMEIDAENGSDFTATMKGLTPNTNYVARLCVQIKKAPIEWSEYGEMTPYLRTFTEEEALKRNGTYYEHALKMEKEQTAKMQDQIFKLSQLLEPSHVDLGKSTVVNDQEKLLQTRLEQDSVISTLQNELQTNTAELTALQQQQKTNEKIIQDLIRESDQLRQQQSTGGDSTRMKENELLLRQYQEKQASDEATIRRHEEALAEKRRQVLDKEAEVERIMQDCRRLVQEHADTAHAKQLMLEDALQQAKQSLEEQTQTNALLREEVQHLGKEQQESTKLIANLQEENTKLRTALEAASLD